MGWRSRQGPIDSDTTWRKHLCATGVPLPTCVARYDAKRKAIALALENHGAAPLDLVIGKDPYGVNPARNLSLVPGARTNARWSTAQSHGWYDFTMENDAVTVRFAGRLENGKPGLSDPLMFV